MKQEAQNVELEQICIKGINHTYAISNVKKEFRKAVDESWDGIPPWKRYHAPSLKDFVLGWYFIIFCLTSDAFQYTCHPEDREVNDPLNQYSSSNRLRPLHFSCSSEQHRFR